MKAKKRTTPVSIIALKDGQKFRVRKNGAIYRLNTLKGEGVYKNVYTSVKSGRTFHAPDGLPVYPV
jgi:hypothetical protein